MTREGDSREQAEQEFGVRSWMSRMALPSPKMT
jgi:hypothetical protein